MDKPFQGYIRDWKRQHYVDGFVIVGTPVGHPKFQGWIRTSKVLDLELNDNGVDWDVETENSLYILLGSECNGTSKG